MGHLPRPQLSRREEVLDEWSLVAVQTDQVTSSEKANHDTQRVQSNVADGQVTRPPRAKANENQVVDGREGGGDGDSWIKERDKYNAVSETSFKPHL